MRDERYNARVTFPNTGPDTRTVTETAPAAGEIANARHHPRPVWPTLPLAMSDEPLEKAVWTDGDFDTMGWHDASVHAIAFHEEEHGAQDALLLDLDYIVRWLDPE